MAGRKVRTQKEDDSELLLLGDTFAILHLYRK